MPAEPLVERIISIVFTIEPANALVVGAKPNVAVLVLEHAPDVPADLRHRLGHRPINRVFLHLTDADGCFVLPFARNQADEQQRQARGF